jgi:hypothetical protein
MGKYIGLQDDVFSIFNSATWKAEQIKTYPSNFVAVAAGNEFIRVSIIASGSGLNLKSVSGVLIIDIFTSAGNGPRQAFLIADKIDQYLVGKSVTTTSGYKTQFSNSSLDIRGLDRDNPSLSRSIYTIPFNYFGVNT